MASVTKNDLLKNPIDFLYIFTNNTFIALVRKYMGATQANTIAQKAANQRHYLRRVYGGKTEMEESAYTDFSDAIYSQYGMTPVTILKKLLAGETVAGKNWVEGVYGVGANNLDGFTQNSSVKVNSSDGTISIGGNSVGVEPTTTYGNFGQTKGVATNRSYTIDGVQYSTRYDRRSKKWYADTYSTGDIMQYADGSTYTPSSASSVWQNIQTALPAIQKFLEWIASWFNFTLIKPQNTVPAQTEFIDRRGNQVDWTTLGIVGVTIFGGALILGDKKKKK